MKENEVSEYRRQNMTLEESSKVSSTSTASYLTPTLKPGYKNLLSGPVCAKEAAKTLQRMNRFLMGSKQNKGQCIPCNMSGCAPNLGQNPMKEVGAQNWSQWVWYLILTFVLRFLFWISQLFPNLFPFL